MTSSRTESGRSVGMIVEGNGDGGSQPERRRTAAESTPTEATPLRSSADSGDTEALHPPHWARNVGSSGVGLCSPAVPPLCIDCP